VSAAVGAPPITCTAYRDWNGRPPYCGQAAGWLIAYGCIHEHVEQVPACGDCVARLRRMLAVTEGVCLACDRGPDAHECRVMVKFKPLAGAR
jgi:hypothetical protein